MTYCYGCGIDLAEWAAEDLEGHPMCNRCAECAHGIALADPCASCADYEDALIAPEPLADWEAELLGL